MRLCEVCMWSASRARLQLRREGVTQIRDLFTLSRCIACMMAIARILIDVPFDIVCEYDVRCFFFFELSGNKLLSFELQIMRY